jgi:hypothetical protein
VTWFVCLLALSAVAFAVFDAARCWFRARTLEAGAFESELREIAESSGNQTRALKNELTLSLEAELGRCVPQRGAHARICFGAATVAVVLLVRDAPLLATVSASVAALGYVVAALFAKAATAAGKGARARWRTLLGASDLSVRHGSKRESARAGFQSE